MKRKINFLVFLTLEFMFMFFSFCYAYNIKPGKVSDIKAERNSKSTLTISWDSVGGAKGYEVYIRSGEKGSFKKVKSTTATQYTFKGATIGKNYYIRIRTYDKNGKVNIYGDYSGICKMPMRKYEYLVNAVEPYESSFFESFSGSRYIKMAGNNYYNGITLGCDRGLHYYGYTYYNLNGLYNKLKFTLGEVDNKNYHEGTMHVITITGDKEILKTIELPYHELPKEFSVNIKNVYQLVIQYDDYWGMVGFADAKLYY